MNLLGEPFTADNVPLECLYVADDQSEATVALVESALLYVDDPNYHAVVFTPHLGDLFTPAGCGTRPAWS